MNIPNVPGYTIRHDDFIASGGEANIWDLRDGNVLKEYHKQKSIIAEKKFDELSKINNRFVIKPVKRIAKIGYIMPQVNDAFPILRLVPNIYKKRHNIDILPILEKLREIFESVHAASCLIVDANELNFLTNDKDVWAIDVDSYQTPSYRATAISPTIQDYFCGNNFSEETDWYSFAVLAYWLSVGCHPYKDGRSSKYKGMSIQDRIKKRALDLAAAGFTNISVPSMAKDPKDLPAALRKWLENILANGERSIPPKDFTALKVIYTLSKAIVDSAKFSITVHREFKENLTSYYNQDGHWELLVGETTTIVKSVVERVVDDETLVFGSNECFLAKLEGNELKITNVRKNMVFSKRVIENAEIYTNKNHSDLFLKAGKEICVLDVDFLAASGIIKLTPTQKLLSKHYISGGIALQNMMGRYYFNKLAVSELDGHKIYDWKAYSNDLYIVFSKKANVNYRTIIRDGGDVVQEKDAQYFGIEGAVLFPASMFVLKDGDDLLIGSTKQGGGFKRLENAGLANSKLVSIGNSSLGYLDGKTVYKVSMKK
jgi:hypothetical protein